MPAVASTRTWSQPYLSARTITHQPARNKYSVEALPIVIRNLLLCLSLTAVSSASLFHHPEDSFAPQALSASRWSWITPQRPLRDGIRHTGQSVANLPRSGVAAPDLDATPVRAAVVGDQQLDATRTAASLSERRRRRPCAYAWRARASRRHQRWTAT